LVANQAWQQVHGKGSGLHVYHAWGPSESLHLQSPSFGLIGIDKGIGRNLLPMTLDAKTPGLDEQFLLGAGPERLHLSMVPDHAFQRWHLTNLQALQAHQRAGPQVCRVASASGA
jgi:hypothetical protein